MYYVRGLEKHHKSSLNENNHFNVQKYMLACIRKTKRRENRKKYNNSLNILIVLK